MIDLRLRYHGRMVSGSLVGRPEQTQLYRDLFWALQRGLRSPEPVNKNETAGS